MGEIVAYAFWRTICFQVLYEENIKVTNAYFL